MKGLVLYLSVILFICGATKANLPSNSDASTKNTSSIVDFHEQLTNADVLRERIKEEEWKDEELPCLNTMLKALNESKNFTLWAVWMMDSIQLPIGQLYGSNFHIGNYDECMNPPWVKTHPEFKTQYCVSDVHLTRSSKNKDSNVFNPKNSAEVYIKTYTKYGRDLAKITWGTCVPEACKPSAIIKIFRTLLKVSHLGYFSEEADISITSCEVAGKPNELSKEVYSFIYALVFMFIIVCLSTCHTTFYYNPEIKSYYQETIRSFCFKRNIKILSIIHDDEIYILNLMRIGSSVVVVIGHLFFMLFGGMIVNGLRIDQEFDEDLAYFSQNNFVVDTFFTMSGLLLVRGFFNGNWRNPYKFLLKRYLRIASGLCLLIYIKTHVFYYMSDGPIWPSRASRERDICIKNWWQNFALTSNYFTENELCYVATWSLPVDFHMSIIAVIFCCIYGRRRRLAISVFWIVLSIAVLLPGLISYIKELPASTFVSIESLVNHRDNILLSTIYVTTHTRAGPFLIGMALGYIIAHYNPNNYRNVISEKWSYILIILSLIVMASISVVGYNLYLEPTRLRIAVFASLHRNIWSIMVAVIITVCEYGDLGDLRDVINWRPFLLLGRLTYGVFLIHLMFIERNLMSARSPRRWDRLSMTEEALGILILSYICSFILWLLVEAPAVNLTNMLFNGIKTEKSKEETIKYASVEKLKTT